MMLSELFRALIVKRYNIVLTKLKDVSRTQVINIKSRKNG